MRTDAAFETEDGVTLRGWIYRPEGLKEPAAGIVMAHGFSGVKGSLQKYAELFSAAGFVVLLYDHRGFGDSDGAIRQEINPHQQISDFRDAITFLQAESDIDPDRIGLWGSSFAGGHAITVAATDRRVKCAVAQVPMISGRGTVQQIFQPDRIAELRKLFSEERQARRKGAAPKTIPVFSQSDELCALPPAVSARFIKASEDEDPLWRNAVTLRSLEYMGEYEPGIYARLVSPTPLLMIVGARDTVTPAEFALEAYERALQPKRLMLYQGGHFAAYYQHFEQTSGEARDWFLQHLPAPEKRAARS